MKQIKFDKHEMPLCKEYDNQTCEFENGDILYIEDSGVSGTAYKNGYILELSWYDNETEMCWSGITVYVASGYIYNVFSYELSYDDNDIEYINSVEYDDFAGCLDVPIYMDPTTEWKALLKACYMWV